MDEVQNTLGSASCNSEEFLHQDLLNESRVGTTGGGLEEVGKYHTVWHQMLYIATEFYPSPHVTIVMGLIDSCRNSGMSLCFTKSPKPFMGPLLLYQRTIQPVPPLVGSKKVALPTDFADSV